VADPGPSQTDTQLEAVERRLKITAESESVHCDLIASQQLEIGLLDLWELLVTPDLLAQWFAPVSGELRLGGTFQVEGNARGTIEHCDPPFAFRATWEFGGGLTHIHVALDEIDRKRTQLTLRHFGMVPDLVWRQYGPGAVGVGCDLVFLGLAHHIAFGSTTPAESTAWATSNDAQEFMRTSSRLWADASVAAGTPEYAARSAEARATAFFLGET
jgi:hypothetical protein